MKSKLYKRKTLNVKFKAVKTIIFFFFFYQPHHVSSEDISVEM